MTTPAYHLNGQLVSPSAFYAVACNPQRSVAVQACAGAGKTWMLVSRIVRALLEQLEKGSLEPQSILAITFTKKSAAEMAERLHQWLHEFEQLSDDELAEQLQQRGLSPTAASAQTTQLRGMRAALLRTGRDVQVKTFHSWFAQLLRSAPLAVLHELQLPASYELLEDDSVAVAQVWPVFYAALLQEPKLNAIRRGDRPVALVGQQDKLLGDQPVAPTPCTSSTLESTLKEDFQASVAEHGRFNTLKALEAALAKRVEFGLADEHGVVNNCVQPFGIQFCDFAGLDRPEDLLARPQGQTLLWAAAKALGQASAPTFAAKGVELEQALTAGDADGIIAALMTKDKVARQFGKNIQNIDAVRMAQGLVASVLEAMHQHDAWLHQQRMARLTRLLIAQYAALKRERGWVDMNDVERAALRLLTDPVLCGWVQERLDARVQHLLIDEFQDTNPLQWQALLAWLSSYAGAGTQAPSVFLVGDPKQSIYRFRRAEPQVFQAAQQFVLQGLGGDLLQCDHTRRNAHAVVALVNQVMGQVQDAGLYSGFCAHTTHSDQAGAVLKLPAITSGDLQQAPAVDFAHWRDSLTTPQERLEDKLRSLECRQVAQLLSHWLGGAAPEQLGCLLPGEVMVLARKRERLTLMQHELLALGIAVQQPEKTELMDAMAVQDVVALLDALVSPQHDLSLAQALKSPLFGVGDDDLVQLARWCKREGGSWWQAVQALGGVVQTDALLSPARGKVGTGVECLNRSTPTLTLPLPGGGDKTRQLLWRDLFAKLTRYQSWARALPPYDALAAIYADADVLARYAQAALPTQREAVLANLRALLSQALELNAGRFATPYNFVRAMKAGGVKAPVVVAQQAVQLLTVHGAKGLEAKLVVLLDTDAPKPKAQSMGVLVDWPGEQPAPVRFVFLANENQPPSCAAEALEIEKNARALEELNALYVATTRAKTTLLISSTQAYQASEHSWWARLQSDCVQVPAPVGAVAQVSADAQIVLLALPKFVGAGHACDGCDSNDSSDEQSRAWPTPTNSEDNPSSRIGLAMHRLLQWRPVLSDGSDANNWAAPTQLAAVRRAFSLTDEQLAQALQAAQAIVQGPAAWAWDCSQLVWWGNEVELMHEGHTLRLDRLVCRQEQGELAWWVLDYKLAQQPQQQAQLLEQMQYYKAAVQAAYPGQTVHAALLSGQGQVVQV